MADKRAYFKLDVGYMSNPKVLAVIDESPAAILLHVASIGYAAQHLTDGVVPVKALLRMTGATQADADLLYAAGLWVDGPTGGKAEVHDYLQHQRSAAEVKGASEKAKRAADAKWSKVADASSNADSNASSMQDAVPDASEIAMPREETEERQRRNKDVGDADDAPKSLALVADPPRADVERICVHLADRIAGNGSKRPTVTKGWRDAARLMVDKDGRDESDVHAAIDWCQNDDFWRANVMSLPTLREKYDQLRLQAQRKRTGSQPRKGDIDWEVARERAREHDARSGA